MEPLILQFQEVAPEAGCDEAGRGCLAGPVVAAAVILDPARPIAALNDSKKLSAKQRFLLRDEIKEKALCYGIGIVEHDEIDKINILNASILAMHKALAQLQIQPAYILVDGNRFKPYEAIPHACMIKGDARFSSIAAASILAKTQRDDLMTELHQKHPQYAWQRNQGYPTIEHRKAIAQFGPSPFHRMTFKLLPDAAQLALFDSE
ncbi:MAG: ribonuclease HII [Flavobacteriales bacterium]